MVTGFKRFVSDFKQAPLWLRLWVVAVCAMFGMTLSSFPKMYEESKKQQHNTSTCRELCLPNGFKEMRGTQCFCEVSIVVKSIPEVK